MPCSSELPPPSRRRPHPSPRRTPRIKVRIRNGWAVVVTGSRIRRVDLETANPVVTIDKAAIERSGKLTVGDLLQNLPSVAGAGPIEREQQRR